MGHNLSKTGYIGYTQICFKCRCDLPDQLFSEDLIKLATHEMEQETAADSCKESFADIIIACQDDGSRPGLESALKRVCELSLDELGFFSYPMASIRPLIDDLEKIGIDDFVSITKGAGGYGYFKIITFWEADINKLKKRIKNGG